MHKRRDGKAAPRAETRALTGESLRRWPFQLCLAPPGVSSPVSEFDFEAAAGPLGRKARQPPVRLSAAKATCVAQHPWEAASCCGTFRWLWMSFDFSVQAGGAGVGDFRAKAIF